MFERAVRIAGRLALFSVLCALALPARPAHHEVIVVGGTGSATPLIRLLADEYRKASPGSRLEIIAPPLGSAGSLRSIAAGKIDIAVTGRLPKDDEVAAVGPSIELGRTPFILVTREGLRPKGFTVQELAEVYVGKMVRWDDGSALRLILRAPFESDTQMLRGMSADMDRAVQAAFNRKGMVIAENDLETIEMLERIPGAVAPSTLGLIATLGKTLHVLPLGGMTPSTGAIDDGSYPWSKPLFAVTGKEPRPEVRKFVAFLRSAAARQILRRYQYLPAST